MTRHPCAGLSEKARDTFEQIATGNSLPTCVHQKTFAALIKRGLIERTSDKIIGRDRFGDIAIPQYQVPILVHMDWCAWCSENFVEEPDAANPDS